MRDILNPWHNMTVKDISDNEDLTERLLAEVICMEELDRKLSPGQLEKLGEIGETVKKAERSKWDIRLMGFIWLVILAICAGSAMSHNWV